MPRPTDTSEKNKRRGGIVVVAIVVAIFAVIFIGLNMRNVDQADEPATAGSQTIENAVP